jgi:hypothetical protein
MMDPTLGVWQVIFDGSLGYPQVTSYINRNNITAGLSYNFMVNAKYQNGYTAESLISSIYSCTIPSGLAPPTLVVATSTSMTL